MNQNIMNQGSAVGNEGQQTGMHPCQNTYCQSFLQAVRHSDAYVRWKGAFGLQFCPKETVELVRLLKDPDIDVQREAVHSLRRHKLNPEQVESVLELTRNPNSFVRRWAWETVVTLPIDLRSHLTECLASETSTLAKLVCARGLRPLGAKRHLTTILPLKMAGRPIDGSGASRSYV